MYDVIKEILISENYFTENNHKRLQEAYKNKKNDKRFSNHGYSLFF